MSKFFTSDLHLGHSNIIIYCNRPFATALEMNRVILEQWNSVVTNDDDVYIIGDVSMHNKRVWLRKFFERANGRKHIIYGNHDRSKKFPSECFASEQRRLEITLDGFAESIILVHDPSEASANHINNQKYLCGHLHSAKENRVYRNWIDVGVDAWDFKPVHEDYIVEILNKMKEGEQKS